MKNKEYQPIELNKKKAGELTSRNKKIFGFLFLLVALFIVFLVAQGTLLSEWIISQF